MRRLSFYFVVVALTVSVMLSGGVSVASARDLSESEAEMVEQLESEFGKDVERVEASFAEYIERKENAFGAKLEAIEDEFAEIIEAFERNPKDETVLDRIDKVRADLKLLEEEIIN